MFKRSLLALAAVVCLALPAMSGEIPNPSGPTPNPTPAPPTNDGSAVQGEIPNPSLVAEVLSWLASIF